MSNIKKITFQDKIQITEKGNHAEELWADDITDIKRVANELVDYSIEATGDVETIIKKQTTLTETTQQLTEAYNNFLPLEQAVRGLNLTPMSGEGLYFTSESSDTNLAEEYSPIVRNMNYTTDGRNVSDFERSIEYAVEVFPNLKSFNMINSWYFDNTSLTEGIKIYPLAADSDKILYPIDWRVAGFVRGDGSATDPTFYSPRGIVDGVADQQLFGGTVTDDAVVEGMKLIVEKGVKVNYYPFIMHGGSDQKWRGYIEVDENNVAAVIDEVVAFFGTTNTNEYSIDQDENGVNRVVFSGTELYSYKRFIYGSAMTFILASLSMTEDEKLLLDKFYIGSEMESLTNTALYPENASSLSEFRFPVTEQLIEINIAIKDLFASYGLNHVRVSYAANIYEYGARYYSDGNHTLYPLDAYWSHPSVDIVSADMYPQVTDWRDGYEHKDYGVGKNEFGVDKSTSYYSHKYMLDNMDRGITDDYYYKSTADREAQIRSPKTDHYNKQWVFSPKRVQEWWENYHYARINGTEETYGATPINLPYSWTPKLKMFNVAECGTSAMKNSMGKTNQFPVKDADWEVPYFSDGSVDEIGQRIGIEVIAYYYSNLECVDPDDVSFWSWESRGPYFDVLEDDYGNPLFADGVLGQRSHTLNVGFGENARVGTSRAGYKNMAPGIYMIDGIAKEWNGETFLNATDVDTSQSSIFDTKNTISVEVDSLTEGLIFDEKKSYRHFLEPVWRNLFKNTEVGFIGLEYWETVEKGIQYYSESGSDFTEIDTGSDYTNVYVTHSYGKGTYKENCDGTEAIVFNTQENNWDSAEIFFLAGNQTGSFKLVNSDSRGDSDNTVYDINTTDTNDPYLTSFTIQNTGSNKIQFYDFSGNNAVYGVWLKNNTEGNASMINVARSNQKVLNFGNLNLESVKTWFSAWKPAFHIWNGGMNDRGTMDKATYKNIVKTRFLTIREVSPETQIVAIIPSLPEDDNIYNLPLYEEAIYEIADEIGNIKILNTPERFGDYQTYLDNNWKDASDDIHELDLFYKIFSKWLMAELGISLFNVN